MSSLESSLLQRISTSTDALEKGLLRAELAACLARLGKFDSARSTITELRREVGWSSPLLISAIMLAEALVLLEDEFSPDALDRLNRGYAISISAGNSGQAAEFAAWIAHMRFNACAFGEAVMWARKCFEQDLANAPRAQIRIYLTLADASRHMGDFEGSEKWYAASRRIAVATSDGAFLAASMYNRALYGVAKLRLNCVAQGIETTDTGQLQIEIESATNYAMATGNDSARYLQQMCKARVLMIQGQYGYAAPLMTQVLHSLPEARHPKFRRTLEGDLAICNLRLGDEEMANKIFDDSESDINQSLDIDDLAVFMHQSALAFNSMGRQIDAQNSRARSLDALARHNSLIAELDAISKLSPVGLD